MDGRRPLTVDSRSPVSVPNGTVNGTVVTIAASGVNVDFRATVPRGTLGTAATVDFGSKTTRDCQPRIILTPLGIFSLKSAALTFAFFLTFERRTVVVSSFLSIILICNDIPFESIHISAD